MKNKVILICPGGRRSILEIQLMYLRKILDLDIVYKYHVWDFAWSKEDSEFISKLTNFHPKLKVKYSPFTNAHRSGNVASKQFAYYLGEYYRVDKYKDKIFVKLDDDIPFIDVDSFERFIDGRLKSDAFLYSANIINNNLYATEDFEKIHTDFLQNYEIILEKNRKKTSEIFSNEKRMSINFISFLGKDLEYINEEFSNGIGFDDEWRLSHKIPKKIGRENEICLFMTVVHYSYGGIIKPTFLDDYKNLFTKYTLLESST